MRLPIGSVRAGPWPAHRVGLRLSGDRCSERRRCERQEDHEGCGAGRVASVCLQGTGSDRQRMWSPVDPQVVDEERGLRCLR